MKIREMGYDDYGITPEEVQRITNLCRSADSFCVLAKAAAMANKSIAALIIASLANNLSYDQLSTWVNIPYSSVDFYAYRRKTIVIMRDLLDGGYGDVIPPRKRRAAVMGEQLAMW